jgi:indole-3-pyruvate monooxygenase
MRSESEALIIGAGPAGLAVAACLQRRGTPLVILEQETSIGSSWRRHYDRLHLHSDRDHSSLPHLRFAPGTPRYPSRDQLIAYLEAYARHFGLAPRLGEQVQSVRRDAAGWVTRTTAGTYRSQHVIVAAGVNAIPYLPQWPGQETFAGRILHSSEYRNAEPFRGQSALIVGFGNSAGEIAIDLNEHGARVSMAVRSAVNIVPREILGVPVLTVAIAFKLLPPGLADALAAPLLRLTLGDLTKLGLRKSPVGAMSRIKSSSRVPLIDIGTVRLIREGRIRLLGGVRCIAENAVTFDDGAMRRFDTIIVATGYGPAFDRFLGPFGPGTSPPGLHFCGFRVTPTGVLREIGIEARRIADQISSH